MVKTKEDLTGKTFGRWKVIKQAEDYVRKNGTHEARWLCECSCQQHTKRIVKQCDLKNGHSQSCGCLMKEINAEMHSKKNEIKEVDGYCIGYTENGEEFWFDKEDKSLVEQYYWSYDNKGYLSARDGSNKHVRLHRLVMGVTDYEIKVDHKKHPPLPENQYDNRKQNLRISTNQENCRNTSLSKNNTSGVTGVCYSKREQKWRAYITVNKKQICLGYFLDKDMAIKARKDAEVLYFGEYRYDENN